MFAYCNNNSTNCRDNTGNDAIWIQEGYSAGGMGHTGLLVQDADGSWFYFYWGPRNEDLTALLGYVPSKMVFEKVDSKGLDLSYLCNVITMLNGSDNQFIKNRAGKITEIVYYEGDYSLSVTWLETLKLNQQSFPIAYEYHLLCNNCVQQSITALSKSNDIFLEFDFVVPNSAVWAAFCVPHVTHQFLPTYWASTTQSYSMKS